MTLSEAEKALEGFWNEWGAPVPRMHAVLLWRKERLFSYLELLYAWKR
nr:hypothetical protein [Spirochaeta thermophila]